MAISQLAEACRACMSYGQWCPGLMVWTMEGCMAQRDRFGVEQGPQLGPYEEDGFND